MIRPLTAVITSNGLLNVRNHMMEILCHDIKINTDDFIWHIKKNPITAFGYNLQGKDSKLYDNFHFSKHDVIRALDFWIEHWVYQNQLEATFTDTVNVDHEITLKELILVRESIMKMPADTKFTRERIKEPALNYYYDGDDDRVITNMGEGEILHLEKTHGPFPKKGHYKKPKLPDKKKIVFTQAVYCEDSSLDPFCHMVLELTPEEYIKYRNRGGRYAFSEEFLMNATNTAGAAFTNITAALTANIQGSMEDLAAALSRTAPITVSAPWTVILPEFEVMSVPAEARSFTIDDTTVEDDEVHTGPDHLLYNNLHPGIPTEEPQAIGILGEPGMISNIVGAAGERLHIGDLIYRNPNDHRWYKGPRTIGNTVHTPILICSGNFGFGETVEAIREATVIYPPNTTPTLYPGDTLLGGNGDNIMVRRRLRNN